MHDEDGLHGLRVENGLDCWLHEEWTAYGDYSYFDRDSQNNRDLLNRAMQVGVDEIWYAAQHRKLPAEPADFAKLIPITKQGPSNHFPLLRFSNQSREWEVRRDIGQFGVEQYSSLRARSVLDAFLVDNLSKYSRTNFNSFLASEDGHESRAYATRVYCQAGSKVN